MKKSVKIYENPSKKIHKIAILVDKKLFKSLILLTFMFFMSHVTFVTVTP